ncbi:hypothetical protein [Megalodesulfovibrio paquesii]
MRVLLAMALCVAILGGVGLYMRRTAPPSPATLAPGAPAAVSGQVPSTFTAMQGVTLVLHATAPLAPSPFAAQADTPALEVLLHGERVASLPALPAFEIHSLPLLVPAGASEAPGELGELGEPGEPGELVIRAAMAPADPHQPHALRAELQFNGSPLGEATAWSLPDRPGLPLTLVLPFDLRHLQRIPHVQ